MRQIHVLQRQADATAADAAETFTKPQQQLVKPQLRRAAAGEAEQGCRLQALIEQETFALAIVRCLWQVRTVAAVMDLVG